MDKELHDLILLTKPSEATDEEYEALLASHAESECPFCGTQQEETTNSHEGGDMDTFTQEEVDAKVSEAVTPLLAEIEALKSSIAKGETETEIATAVAEVEAAKADVEARLDAAVLEASAAKDQLDAVMKFLESAVEEAELRELYEADKASRIAKIKDLTSFSDDYINENIERWMKDSAEEFELRLADWTATSAQAEATKEISAETAEIASRGTVVTTTRPIAPKEFDVGESLSTLMGAARSGVNLTKIK